MSEQVDPDALAQVLRRRLVERTLVVPVTGSSMSGTIESGSDVEIRSQGGPRIGEVWAVITDEGDLVVHRIRRVTPGGIVTRGSANPIDDSPLRTARLVGRVVGSKAPSGSTRVFGHRDRIRAAIEFALRRVVRKLVDGVGKISRVE